MRIDFRWSLVIILSLVIGGWSFALPPQRIISGMPSITEMLYALDLGDRIVGVTSNCNYPPEARKKEKVGGFFLNLEKVVSLKPDLVIMLEDAQKRDIKKFKDYGLPVIVINPRSVNEVLDTMLELGKIAGKEETAREVTKKMRRRINAVEARVSAYQPKLADILKLWDLRSKQRKVLVVVGINPLIVAGGGTFIDDILKYAGVENMAGKSRAAYPQYSFEKLIEENPPYLIIIKGSSDVKQIQSDRRWQSLEAVRGGRIFSMDADILSRPGPRVVEAIEQVAGFIYP